MKRIATTSFVMIVLLVLTAPPACSQEHGYTISSSPTDPLVNTTSFAPGPEVLYLWLYCGDPMSRGYFTATSSDPLNTVTSVNFLNGFTCLVPACNNPLVFDAPGGCISGPIPVAQINVLNNGGPGEWCLTATQWGGGTLSCPTSGLWATQQIGFAHIGVTRTCSTEICEPIDTDVSQSADRPSHLKLSVTPNPGTSGSVELSFALPGNVTATLTIFDVAGRRVRTLFEGTPSTGVGRVAWDGRDERGIPVVSGTYFAQISTRDFQETKRLVLMR